MRKWIAAMASVMGLLRDREAVEFTLQVCKQAAGWTLAGGLQPSKHRRILVQRMDCAVP